MGRFVEDIEKEVKDEIKRAKKFRLSWRSLSCLFVCFLPVILVFDHFGHLNELMPIFSAVTVFCGLIVLKRELVNRRWFWIALTVLFALHLRVILTVPWTDKWVPGLAYAGVASLDLCVMLVIIDSIHRFIEGPRPRKKRVPTKADS